MVCSFYILLHNLLSFD